MGAFHHEQRYPVLTTKVDRKGETFRGNREAALKALEEIRGHVAKAHEGGGAKYNERHVARGKLLPRQRVELLLDRDSPFLEVGALAGTGMPGETPGTAVVGGVGRVSGVECLVVASEATVKGGAITPMSMVKTGRLSEIAEQNRLVGVSLIESAGADLPNQDKIFVPGGAGFRSLTQRSEQRVPTVCLVFGSSTAGGAYLPGMSDYVVMVKEQAQVYLAGPPLVKMATGEDSDDESLGGAEMHARVSGLADYFAVNEMDGIRLGRQVIKRINHRKKGAGPRGPGRPPKYDPDQLLGIPSADPKVPFDPREVIARVVDDSDFDEFKPLYGTSLVTGWAEIHGYPVGILANHRGVLFNEESEKAAQFIQLANQIDTPLVFLQNTTGYMVGKEFEQRGIIKDGAKMINAVSNSKVPHLTIHMGASYGAGNYGMCGRAYGPRFLFAWPNAKTAVMGPAQLAGVMSIVAKQSAESMGKPFDEEADANMRQLVEEQIERESLAMFMSGKLYDDGIIDPRDTRTVLGMCLSVIDNQPIAGTRGYGVFRM